MEQKKRRSKSNKNDKTDNKLNKAFISQRIEVLPLKVIYEYQNGREYLLAWSSGKKDFRIIRLDDIFDPEICKKTFDPDEKNTVMKKLNDIIDSILYSYKRDARSHIEIDFDVPEHEIKRAFGIGTVIPITDKSCRFTADINNCSDIVPLVLRYGSRAHVSKEHSPELYGIIKEQSEEAIRDYGLIQ